ncbi:MAG: hypothetical protein JW745_06630 [Sedimentisphaerales bacterium]|nr:hypothetical protein [Sedimentisphaerales bacterium]MBN2843906.1 hypothetical protein [Sedimentisphaerales bacterium]
MNFFEDKIEEQETDDIKATPATAETQEPADDDMSYAISSKSSSRNTYILLTVCVLAIVGVWLAGLAHKTPADEQDSKSDKVSKLDIALAKLVGVKNTADSELLVNAFYELPGGKQVKLDELNKNPFVLQEKIKEESQQDDLNIAQKVLREKQLNSEAGSLKLNSIMKGPNGNFCMINGEIYKVGDKVTDSFKIKQIEMNKVVLEADDYTCQLEL